MAEKSARKKAPEKKRQKKVTEKTQARYDAILAFMNTDVWYKASDLAGALGIKETRTKELLRSLVEDGLLVNNGVIKGRKYKKV